MESKIISWAFLSLVFFSSRRRQTIFKCDWSSDVCSSDLTLACKSQWTDRGGREFMYWNHVETKPGKGFPRDWEAAGGGWENGSLKPGKLPRRGEDYGVPAH